jgi:RNA polymerase sigma factor (sigma-70 family)
MPDDLELLELWRAGDRSAGERLFSRHFDSVYRFFDTKCDGDVDELVQRTFLACVQSKDRFRAEASFRTYLFTIARHELFRHYRQRRRQGEPLDGHLTSVAQLVTTPRSRLARHQAHRRLLHALCSLPLETQTLIELHYWEDFDIPALAAVFGAPQATIRTRLFRARRALEERLQGSSSGQGI